MTTCYQWIDPVPLSSYDYDLSYYHGANVHTSPQVISSCLNISQLLPRRSRHCPALIHMLVASVLLMVSTDRIHISQREEDCKN